MSYKTIYKLSNLKSFNKLNKIFYIIYNLSRKITFNTLQENFCELFGNFRYGFHIKAYYP